MSENNSSDCASEQYRFFIYDPAGFGFKYYQTTEDRDKDQGNVIQAYLDDGWDEEVENVVAGEVTHTCQKINIEHRPEKLDEDGHDEDGNYWAAEWDYKCNYDLVPVAAPTPQAWLDVQAERRRQIETKGWIPEHDDEHVCDEIAGLACFYAMPPGARDWNASSTGYGDTLGRAMLPDGWLAKTGDRRCELVKAGALILAEIERLDRAAAPAQEIQHE